MLSRSWRERERALVCYAEDPVLWHERLVLGHVGNSFYAVVTPDRDRFVQELALPALRGLIESPWPAMPAMTKAEECYLIDSSDAGAFAAGELEALIRTTREELPELRKAKGFVDLTSGAFRCEADYVDAGLSKGEVVDVCPGSFEKGGKLVRDIQGVLVLAVFVPHDAYEEWKASVDSADIRVLPVAYDLANAERFRTVEEAVGHHSTVPFEDWPLHQPRSSAWFCKTLRRQNMTFLSHHADWVRSSGIRDGDRAVHEHASISRALHYGCCYDQLNMGNVAMVESLIKRIMLIEQAYQGRPTAPVYDGAEHWMGVQESLDGTLIDPAARKQVADKLKEDAAIKKEGRKWREEHPKLPGQAPKGGGKGAAEA